jgi:hypothetical protein
LSQLLLLVVGFVLTTVVGGLLGYFFQNRAWDHQNRITTEEARRTATFAVFEELSSLMDRRLYRMRVFDSALASDVSAEEIEAARAEYRLVRYDWNDNLNRNLARVESYFGPEIRSDIELGIYEDFSRLHTQLSRNYERRCNNNRVDSIGPELDAISDRVYQANVQMLQTLRP